MSKGRQSFIVSKKNKFDWPKLIWESMRKRAHWDYFVDTLFSKKERVWEKQCSVKKLKLFWKPFRNQKLKAMLENK